ncbi:MAG: hypothetical protein LBB85_04095 [Dysgonamonadaceae bacterium]|jgi:hypothetical protein|nr:hypothetical protein [Dysgonamonadaceae bacterium]
MKKTVFNGSQLLLLGLTLLLGACEKEVPDAPANGGRIAVKFNIVGVSEGTSEEVLRSGGEEPETQIVPLDNGLSLEISLERDSRPLRAATPQPLPAGTTYRLMAVEASNRKLLAMEDGVVGSNAPVLHVPADATCNFYALSCNTTEAIPAFNGYEINKTVPFYTNIDNSSDFLFWKSSSLTKDANNEYWLDITFEQKLIQLKIIIEGVRQFTGTTVKITDISTTSPVTIDPVYVRGQFSYDGNISDASLRTSVAFDSWTYDSSNCESGAKQVFKRMYALNDPLTLTIPANAISLEDGYQVPVSQTTVKFSDLVSLTYGNRYTLRVKIWKLSQKFASSNIYWDGEKLTFKPYVADPSLYEAEQQYQGVPFKFGSLIGVSPSGGYHKDTTSIYVPYYNSGSSPTWVKSKPSKTTDNTGNSASPHEAFTWDTSNGSNENGATAFWPYIDKQYPDLPYSNYYDYTAIDANWNTVAMWNSFRGDICQYISATQGKTDPTMRGYRLPVVVEFLNNGDWQMNSSFGDQTSDKNDGTFRITGGCFRSSSGANSVFFPASGHRRSYQGLISSVGTRGSYWSGSGSEGSYCYQLSFTNGYKGNVPYTHIDHRTALMVRCILQE